MPSILRTAEPPFKPSINDWFKYIHKQTANTVRPGGVAHIEGQKAALKSAKQILKSV